MFKGTKMALTVRTESGFPAASDRKEHTEKRPRLKENKQRAR